MKISYIKVMIAISATIFAISCDKQQEINDLTTVVKGLTIKASADNSSRTTFNGAETTWSANDEIKVLISDGNFATPKSGIFALSNATQKTFTNNDIEISTGVEYKFHAIYPATDIDSETQSASVEIGAASQTQNDTAPAAHIAALDPLYGCATATPEAVSINMNHTAVALKLDLQNDTGNNITIKKLLVTAPTGVAIVGKHNINIETDSITPSSAAGATSNIIELSINEPATIANNASFTAWIASAPFSIAEGGSLLFTVIDSNNNEYDVIKSFVDGHTFSSGKVASTTLTINDAAKVTSKQNKEVTLDFTNAGNFRPSTTPSTPTTNLVYKSGIDISHIYATNGCYYNNNEGLLGLLLNEIKNNHFCTITLPQLTGHKITKIVFNNVKNDKINATIELYNRYDVRCKFVDIVDYINKDRGYFQNITQKQVTINNIVGITDDAQYYIKFTQSNNPHHIKSWVITYQRIR